MFAERLLDHVNGVLKSLARKRRTDLRTGKERNVAWKNAQ